MLVTSHSYFKFPSIKGVGSVGGGTSQDPWIVEWIKWNIMTMLLIISNPFFFIQCDNSFTIHSFTYPLDAGSIVSYVSLVAILYNDKKPTHSSSSSSSFQQEEKEKIYPRRGSRWQSQPGTGKLYRSSRGQFRIWRRTSSVTIQEWNVHAAIKKFLHSNTWKTSRINSSNSRVGKLLHAEYWEVYIVLEEADKREPAPKASRKVFDYAFEWLNPPANVYIWERMDPIEAGEQLVECKGGYLRG